jgi:hypothetical protein
MASKDDHDEENKAAALKQYELVKADIMKRMVGTMRFAPGKEWLREAAMQSVEKRATSILVKLQPDQLAAVAAYIEAVK